MARRRERSIESLYASMDGGGDADYEVVMMQQLASEGIDEEQLQTDMTVAVRASQQLELADKDELDEQERGKPSELLRFLLRMGFGSLMHPYEYAKVLIQLGYEPLPAVSSNGWLGRTTPFLPSVHQYVRYIKHTDGFAGLYRGLLPRVLGCASSAIFAESIVHLIGMERQPRSTLGGYVWNLLRDSIIVTTGLCVAHPFYVITVRQMGQFVGREVAYSTLAGSVREILAQEGPMGFYAGFVPRLLSDLGVLWVTTSLGAICNRLFRSTTTQRDYNSALLQFGVVVLFYPLQLVGACMACSGSGLAVGAPPFMPIYCQWLDCLLDLYGRGDHYRGAFNFRRAVPRVQVKHFYDPMNVARIHHQ